MLWRRFAPRPNDSSRRRRFLESDRCPWRYFHLSRVDAHLLEGEKAEKGSLTAFPRAWIESIPKAIPKEVEGHDACGNGEPGEEREGERPTPVIISIMEHRPPFRCARFYTEPKER